MEPLDNILSSGGGATPAAQDAKPEKDTTQPDVSAAQAQQTEEPEPEGTQVGADGQKTVPLQALHAERQKVKRYTEQVADFEKKLEAQAAETRRFQQMMLERLAPQKQEQQQPAPDWYENPDNALNHRLQQVLGPVIQQQRDMHLAIAREATEARYGDKANEAIQAFDRAVSAGQVTQAEYQRIMGSPNPFGAAVQWHQQQERLSPDYESKIRADERAKALAELGIQPNGAQANNGNGAAPVMPSNLAGARNVGTRAGPAWAGPKSLNDIFAR